MTNPVRFIYTRYEHSFSDKPVASWVGTILTDEQDEFGCRVVSARRDDTGEVEWFWNGSFSGSPTESIELLPEADDHPIENPQFVLGQRQAAEAIATWLEEVAETMKINNHRAAGAVEDLVWGLRRGEWKS